jgi:murein DD-endopeptidase MepM/ murein hydrolase activator NlpD
MEPSPILVPPLRVWSQTQAFGINRAVYSKYKTSYGEPFAGHNGYDSSAVIGSPVAAMDAGIVEQVLWDPKGFGLHVVIRGSQNTRIWYAHLSAVYCWVGQPINQGEIFAATCHSGWSTGPHLHVTVKWLAQKNPGYGDAIDFKPLVDWNRPVVDWALPTRNPIATAGPSGVQWFQ